MPPYTTLKSLVPTMIALSCGHTVTAQEQPSDADAIVISGEQIERTQQENLSSVAVITEDTLVTERRFHDLVNRTANVGLNGTDDRISIRGIALFGTGAAGEANTITIDLDGVPVDNWASYIGWSSLWDVEQVEVLRGAQSTNQGRNALAGAVVYRSAPPTWYHTGKARIFAASDETFGIAAAHGGPLVTDTLAFRISAEHETSEGFITNTTTNEDDYAGYERTVARGSLLWRPTQDESLEVLTTYSLC